jgi:hypothetical protein
MTGQYCAIVYTFRRCCASSYLEVSSDRCADVDAVFYLGVGMPADSPRPTIRCPHCGQEIQLDEAMAHQLAAPLRARWEEEIRQRVGAEVRAAYAQDLADQAKKRSELEDRLKERDSKIRDLQDKETKLLKATHQLEEEKAALDLERERMRAVISREERDKATKLANQRAALELQRKEAERQEEERRKDEEYQVKVRQLEDQLTRVKDQLAEAERKARTGSRQEEGYARQEVFAAYLLDRFPQDRFQVTKRGERGADVTQEVRVAEHICGTILWECKDTAAWSGTWPAKLADDVKQAGASIGIIVSTALPGGMDGFGERDGAWVCGYDVAAVLATGLREKVISDRRHELANAGAGSADRVYNYVMTGDFGVRFTTLGQIAARLLHDLDQDKRALEQRWKRTERRIREMVATLDAIPLDLRDVLGADADLPPALRAEFPGTGTPAELPASPAAVLA